MLQKLIHWSLHNIFLVLLLTFFTIAGGIYAVMKTPLDAIPDLSDVQVIVYTDYAGQAPQVVEDQVTYPLTSALLSVPKAKVVRGYSFFGSSFVYVIFEDNTDLVITSYSIHYTKLYETSNAKVMPFSSTDSGE